MVSPSVLRIGDVADEAILLAGGARAILLQLANPAVGHGVADHSDFANRPLDRLRGTLTYLYVIVYGTPEESAIVARRVGAAHTPVRGDDYDARDASLQLWVAATLYETAMRVHELVFGSLSDADAESLLADYAIVGTALGVPVALWPADRRAFAEYWERSEANLRVDASAQRVARELLFPRRGPWWLKLSMPTVRVITAGLLSDDLRAAYDLPLNSARYARLVRVVRAIYPRLPRAIRQWPKRHYLRKFRRGLAG
jgi:uncharacterized protein (DUF2236 family)